MLQIGRVTSILLLSSFSVNVFANPADRTIERLCSNRIKSVTVLAPDSCATDSMYLKPFKKSETTGNQIYKNERCFIELTNGEKIFFLVPAPSDEPSFKLTWQCRPMSLESINKLPKDCRIRLTNPSEDVDCSCTNLGCTVVNNGNKKKPAAPPQIQEGNAVQ